MRTILPTAAHTIPDAPRIRKKPSRWTWLTPAEHNTTNAPILRLPGEIRNAIYTLTIYPSLSYLTFVHSNLLHLPSIFRVCAQLRAEALSYLCASKELRILGIDVACKIFKSVGNAVRDAKRIVLSQPLAVLGNEEMNAFFDFLDRAEGLRYLRLEIGMVEWRAEMGGLDVLFLERVRGFVEEREKKGVGMVFEWCAGAYDSRAGADGRAGERAVGVRRILGEENEVSVSTVGGRGGGPMMW